MSMERFSLDRLQYIMGEATGIAVQDSRTMPPRPSRTMAPHHDRTMAPHHNRITAPHRSRTMGGRRLSRATHRNQIKGPMCRTHREVMETRLISHLVPIFLQQDQAKEIQFLLIREISIEQCLKLILVKEDSRRMPVTGLHKMELSDKCLGDVETFRHLKIIDQVRFFYPCSSFLIFLLYITVNYGCMAVICLLCLLLDESTS